MWRMRLLFREPETGRLRRLFNHHEYFSSYDFASVVTVLVRFIRTNAMKLVEIPNQVVRYSVTRRIAVCELVSRRRISRRTLEQARHGSLGSIHSGAAMVLLLHDLGASDRGVEFTAHGREFVLLTKTDFQALTTHQLN